MAKFDDFSLKITKLFGFVFKFRPTKGFVPDLVGLLERFSSFPTVLIQFYEILTVKIEKKLRFELLVVLFSWFSRLTFLTTVPNTHWVIFPVNLRRNRPRNVLLGLEIGKIGDVTQLT